jgi:hypothetical protein
VASAADGRFCVVKFAGLYGIINIKLEKHRGSQVTGIVLCDRRTCSRSRNLFWRSRQKSACCLHCVPAQYYPDNPVHHISCWWNRCGCFLCEVDVDTVACLGALRPRRDFPSASLGIGGVDSGERCRLLSSSVCHHETNSQLVTAPIYRKTVLTRPTTNQYCFPRVMQPFAAFCVLLVIKETMKKVQQIGLIIFIAKGEQNE